MSLQTTTPPLRESSSENCLGQTRETCKTSTGTRSKAFDNLRCHSILRLPIGIITERQATSNNEPQQKQGILSSLGKRFERVERERKLQSKRNQGEGTIPLTHPVMEQRNRHPHFDSPFPSIEDRGFPRWVAIYSPAREGRINP